MGRPQRTIENSTDVSGKALFGGQETTARLRPADPSTGVLFVRTDLPDNPVVPATVEALSDGFQCTMLAWNEVQVRSPEHLLSACRGVGVDNLMVELDSPELPAAGGNGQVFARAMLDAGITDQEEQADQLELEETVSVSDGDTSIVAMPADEGLTISYLLEFEGEEGPPQAYTFQLDREAYMQDIAPARTFATDSVEKEFRRRSIGGGVTDDNAVVVRGDLTQGVSRQGPFNVILINGAIETLPEALVEQLADGGRLVAVRREGTVGRGVLLERVGNATGERVLFDANTPVLHGFAAQPGFVF